MKKSIRAAVAGALLFSAIQAGAVSATGYITYAANGSSFDYTIHLTNTGPTEIVQVWYAWRPGENYMATMPSAISGPTNWNYFVTGGVSGDGYGINYVKGSGTAIFQNQTRTFKFTSASTPSELAGTSVAHPNELVGTTYIYDASGVNKAIFIKPVPEPASIVALAAGLVALARRRR